MYHLTTEECMDKKDEELIELYHQGQAEAAEVILERYKKFVKSKARYYFLLGADREDIIQEGMIGLYKAICSYDESRMVSFHAFADICIKRQMFSAIKTAMRHKHLPLNSYVSFSKPIYHEETDAVMSDMIATDDDGNPEKIVIDKESFAKIQDDIGKILSEFERRVLSLYLQGKTYQEIAGALQKELKSIDNALQRIKKKLLVHLAIEQ